jgi:hypothetical protein
MAQVHDDAVAGALEYCDQTKPSRIAGRVQRSAGITEDLDA